MVRYHLPEGMRYSKLGEREIFYKEEFNLQKVAEHVQRSGENGGNGLCSSYREAYNNLSSEIQRGRVHIFVPKNRFANDFGHF